MDEKKPPDRYYYSRLGLLSPINPEDDGWGSDLTVGPSVPAEPFPARPTHYPATFTVVDEQGNLGQGPSVEPHPFDCPVCEHVGFDCGAHSA